MSAEFTSKCCQAAVTVDRSNPNWTIYVCSACGSQNPLTVEDILKATKASDA